MPDATITSTASTFGTISGTFAADQSTVTGTITAITGTVDGSVGVPGPQGPQGIQGIQGIQGVPGSPGAPGQGVAAGGSTGQVLQKLSATSYDTGWLTLPADYITSVTAPLAVASGNLTVDLSAYLPLAGGYMTGAIFNNNAIGGLYLSNFSLGAGWYTNVSWSGIQLSGGSGPTAQSMTIQGDGITFATSPYKQTTPFLGLAGYATEAWVTNGFYPLAGNPSGFLTDAPSNGSQYARKNGAWDVVSTTPDFISSVSSPLSVTTANLTIDLSAYLTSATAASTYYLQTNPANFIDASALTGYATETFVTTQGYITQATADGLYYPLSGNPSGFLTSVPPPSLTNLTSDISWDGSANIGRLLISGVNDIGGGFTEARLNFTSGVPTQPATGDFWTNGTDFFYRESGSTKTIASQSYVSATYQTLAGMSSYLTTATAASTYAVIAAGQPVAGTTGQVLTKQSGTNWDSIWATPVVGDRYLTTSTTSNTINNANKTFTIGTGLSYTPTQNITISYNAANHMHGEVLTYNSGTGVLTVDIKNHTGSGTYAAWVVNVGGVTPATSVAWGAITGTLSAQTDLQSALDLKSNLASPTFTGTPSLPTGTTAVTQTAGNNTTALATTAFVTAAVPAFATSTQSRAATSATVAQSPNSEMWQMMNPGFIRINRAGHTYTATGTMGTFTAGWYSSLMNVGAGIASARFRSFGTSQIDQSSICVSKGYKSYIDFSRYIWCSGRFYTENGAWSDPNVSARFYFGKAENSGTGDPARKCFGWSLPGNATAANRNPVLQVHNGTTLTSVATTFAVVGQQYFDWDIVSLGNGTVTLYINGTQYATTSAGPTGDTSYSGSAPVIWQEELVATAVPTLGTVVFSRGILYIAP